MARPIAETPILLGEDAASFEERMRRVDCMSEEERKDNMRKLIEAVSQAKKIINVCI